jgi:hypothetical protein
MRFSTSPTGPITLIARSLPADLDALSSSMYRLLLIVMDPDLKQRRQSRRAGAGPEENTDKGNIEGTFLKRPQ